MTEEQVTKIIINWLKSSSWEIICFDFPQSGTGKMIHPNNHENDKNLGTFIPDIVAVRNDTAVFFENKDRFFFQDYLKVNHLINSSDYSDNIESLLADYSIANIYYGIGLPLEKHKKKSQDSQNLVDFIIGVSNSSVDIIYQKYNIF